MNILFLADIFPYPANSGGRLRTYNLIKQLSKENKIDLICKHEQEICEKDMQIFSRYLNDLETIFIHKKSNLIRGFRLFFNKSDKLYLSYSDEYQQKLNKWLKTKEYDLIFVDSLYMYQYVYMNNNVDRTKVKILLDLHNVEHEIIYRMMKNSNSIPVKLYSWKEYKNIVNIEKKYTKDADIMITVSKRDREEYIKLYNINKNKIHVIDNGVDIKIAESYKMSSNKVINEKYILFIGSLWYRANRDGINWFVNNIWPQIHKYDKELKLKIIGKNTDGNETKSANNVEYLGFIEDIYAYYKQCKCFVVPLKYGSGTRLKILEAMSFKVPIVSTTIGAEGLLVENYKNILIKDEEEEFVEGIKSILEDKKLADDISREGHMLVKEKYDWDKIGLNMNKILEIHLKRG